MTREHYDLLLAQLDDQVLEMGDVVARTISTCMDALDRRDAALAQRVVEADDQIDNRRYEIERQALVLIATQQPAAGDLRTITAMLTIATELERIGDYSEGIAKLVLRMAAESLSGPLFTIHGMAELTQRLLREVLVAYKERDVAAAGQIWLQDDDVDDLYEQVFRKLLAGMVDDPSTVRLSTYLLWVAHNLERMADRVTNIAERVAFVVTGDVSAFRNDLAARSLPR
jgi:phosphate transport system protein